MQTQKLSEGREVRELGEKVEGIKQKKKKKKRKERKKEKYLLDTDNSMVNTRRRKNR